MVDEVTFFSIIGVMGAMITFTLHRLFSLRGEVSAVATAIEYKNEKLDSIGKKVERIDSAIDKLNITMAKIETQLKIGK